MADFKTSILVTLDHEKGFQKLHNDSGNWTGGEVGKGELKGTKWGISAAQFPTLDIENLTVDQAVDIYREGYWKQHYGEIFDQAIATKLFDMGVLFGVHAAVKCLQEILFLKTDGIFGPSSLEAVNQHAGPSLLSIFKTGLVALALAVVTSRPEKREYFHSWVTRINS